MNGFARGLLVLMLAVGMLGFGAIGLCGGYFTIWLMTDLRAGALLLLSLPCLLGGLFMGWVCVNKMRQMLRGPQQGEKETS